MPINKDLQEALSEFNRIKKDSTQSSDLVEKAVSCLNGQADKEDSQQFLMLYRAVLIHEVSPVKNEGNQLEIAFFNQCWLALNAHLYSFPSRLLELNLLKPEHIDFMLQSDPSNVRTVGNIIYQAYTSRRLDESVLKALWMVNSVRNYFKQNLEPEYLELFITCAQTLGTLQLLNKANFSAIMIHPFKDLIIPSFANEIKKKKKKEKNLVDRFNQLFFSVLLL